MNVYNLQITYLEEKSISSSIPFLKWKVFTGKALSGKAKKFIQYINVVIALVE